MRNTKLFPLVIRATQICPSTKSNMAAFNFPKRFDSNLGPMPLLVLLMISMVVTMENRTIMHCVPSRIFNFSRLAVLKKDQNYWTAKQFLSFHLTTGKKAEPHWLNFLAVLTIFQIDSIFGEILPIMFASDNCTFSNVCVFSVYFRVLSITSAFLSLQNLPGMCILGANCASSFATDFWLQTHLLQVSFYKLNWTRTA